MPKKYQAIIDLKTDDISWTEAAKQAGYTGRWTSDGKGGVKQKSSTGGGQARRRRQFDRPSTDAASAEAKRLEQERLRINREAEMYGLEPTQIEHLSDQSDAAAIKFGAAGDPSNKAIVRTSDARLKDLVKQKVGDDYAVTLDPSTESIKVIPQKYFDPLADPSTLPGETIRPGQVAARAFVRGQPNPFRNPTVEQQAVDRGVTTPSQVTRGRIGLQRAGALINGQPDPFRNPTLTEQSASRGVTAPTSGTIRRKVKGKLIKDTTGGTDLGAFDGIGHDPTESIPRGRVQYADDSGVDAGLPPMLPISGV